MIAHACLTLRYTCPGYNLLAKLLHIILWDELAESLHHPLQLFQADGAVVVDVKHPVDLS